MKNRPYYSMLASEIADGYIKSSPFMFRDSLRNGIVSREEMEFYFFVGFGFDGSWTREYVKKVEQFPLQLVNAYDLDNAGFVCVADVLGKTPEEIEKRWTEILKKMNDHFNKRGERYTEEEYRKIIEEMDRENA